MILAPPGDHRWRLVSNLANFKLVGQGQDLKCLEKV